MSVVSSCPFWDETAYYFVGSFRGAGSAREPGTYEHGPRRKVRKPVFIVSGPGPRAVPE